MKQKLIPFDLKKWREQHKYDTLKLCSMLGLSRSTVLRYEGKGRVPVVFLFALKGVEIMQRQREVV